MHQVEVATTQETLLDNPEMVLNMGPQHPSTHGVLRVVLRLDGETVIDLDCDIGFLHRGMEKIAENRLYPMIAPYWDRLDYIAAVSNGLVVLVLQTCLRHRVEEVFPDDQFEIRTLTDPVIVLPADEHFEFLAVLFQFGRGCQEDPLGLHRPLV